MYSRWVILLDIGLDSPYHGSRLSAIVEVIPFTSIEMDGWKLIALFDTQIISSEIQNMSKSKQNQLLQLILKSQHKPINKMDLQREIRNALTEKTKAT